MDNQRVEIYSPRYDGKRFEDHRLPLDLIEDLPVLQELTIELAKYLYREKNSERERIPKNFTKGISFELESIEEGSTIPTIVLICQLSGLFPTNPNLDYFKEASGRIIDIIQGAENGEEITDLAPQDFLKKFSRLGKKLGHDESIEFRPNKAQKAKFTKESRKRIIQASSNSMEYTDEIGLRGLISEMDLNKQTFTIDLISGQRLESFYANELEDILINAFTSFKSDQKQKILLEGSIRFSKTDSIIKIEKTQSITELYSDDIGYRLEEISLLKEGWLDGQGSSFSKKKLEELSKLFDEYFDDNLPLPKTFPTPEGGIQFEWANDNFDVSALVEIDDSFSTQVHSLSFSDDKEVELQLNLLNKDEWVQFNRLVKSAMIEGSDG
ncbi:hypothetical protein [Croceimicrobium sp.]|uniref:hypothetical protein n=1 Tax=Croceimicrobium sp. TaxID=2828340 RepID=UPI003BA84BE8